MRVVTKQHLKKLTVAAALFGSIVLAFAGSAQADDHWDRDRGEDRHREHEWREHEWREHHVHYAPRYVEQRPVYVAPPVVYAPPVYAVPAPSSLNLNFNIPLQ